jgi:hypothetical protein
VHHDYAASLFLAHSRCGLGAGPNGECCAPEGVVPAGAFAAAPTPERQAYDPVIIETTVVIAPNGTAISNETVIVGGGRRDLATVLDEPTTRRLGAGNCVNGILNTQTSACCASSCGSCGGTGCRLVGMCSLLLLFEHCTSMHSLSLCELMLYSHAVQF